MDTPASLGQKSMHALELNGLISRMDDDENTSHNLSRPAVLDSDSFQQLLQLTNEHQLIAFLTPVFERILVQVPGVQVVNSEEYPWLETSSGNSRFNQKPDNIFCHDAFYNHRAPFNTDDPNLVVLRRHSSKYGVLADWSLRDCIDAIGEAKIKITNAALGEVINYARHVCFHIDGPKYTKLLLYDKEEFWMIRATLGEISSVCICRWNSSGSMQHFMNFFQEGRSPWVRLLMAACAHWDLAAEHDAFLGKGTFGRVFKVKSQVEGGHQVFKALKLVLPGDDGVGALDLLREYKALVDAAKILPETVARVDGFHNFGGMGAALLLADIGDEVPRRHWQQLFETLGALHEKNILHGDPRLPNAIFVDGKVRWIDFRNLVVAIDPASVTFKRDDIEILFKSCCHKLFPTMRMEESGIQRIVADYDGTIRSAALIFDAFQRLHG